ncbi:MAG: hypothetical protein OXH99_08065 [Bryobacterales bacterium]|nr:hypothetical protein [Bryobacterales bacterium]
MVPQVERAPDRTGLAGGNVDLAGGGGKALMAEQQLDGAHGASAFEQMVGEGV